MKRAKAAGPGACSYDGAKLRILPMLLLLGCALASCMAQPAALPEAAVPGQPAETTLAAIDKQLHESALAPPASEEKKAAEVSGKSAPAEKPGKSSWKKDKDAQKVAPDDPAAGKLPATAKAVDLADDVQAGPQAKMRIKHIEQTKSEAEGIGEIAGAATLVEIELSNDGTTTLDLDKAQLRLFYGEDLEPAALLTDARSTVLPAQLAAGKKAVATYLFSAQTESATFVTLEFETGATKKIQQLAGEVSP
jgi:hypothetical protein